MFPLCAVTWGSLQNPQHKPQAPATEHRVTSNQIFCSPCQAAAISHFSSDLDGPNVGIHYHTRALLRLRSVLSPARHRRSASVCLRGPLSSNPRLACAAPAPGSSSRFSRCSLLSKDILLVSACRIRDSRFNVMGRDLDKRSFVAEPHLISQVFE